MARALPVLLATLLLMAAAMPAAAVDEPPIPTVDLDTAYVTDHVIVRWADEAAAGEVTAEQGLERAEELPGPGTTELVSTEGQPVPQVLAELNADPAVEFAEPDYIVHLAEEPQVTAVGVNDSRTGDQYSLDRMRVRDAWSITTGGSNLVAVLDTGVDFGHADLQGRLVAGHDFVNNDGHAADDNGHGTWVSGIIAATPNNAIGIAGVSWSDRILPVKVMDAAGSGLASNLTAGIIWAADRGAKVINMSVGGFPASQHTSNAVNYAWSRGAVLVGAAGNNGRLEDFYPASYGNVVSVSATQLDDEFTFWSNYSGQVDVSAPGASVITTNCRSCKPADGDYTHISGTSFAAPNVAGVVAMLWARFPNASNNDIVAQLYRTVDDLGYGGWDNRYGHGRVNALRAVGGSSPGPAVGSADGLEPNNTLSVARFIGLGTIHPNLYPAGDLDFVAIDAPRAGRIDVSARGMSDARPQPWVRSALPIDPMISVYDASGALVRTVNAVGSTGTEVASIQVPGPGRVFARISNATPNGNRNAYTLTTSYADNVAPHVVARTPAPGVTGASRFGTVTATLNEPVTNATTSTVALRDMATSATVPITVSLAAGGTQLVIRPAALLGPERRYRAELSAGVHDLAGNDLAGGGVSWEFTTGLYGYLDIGSSPFADDIVWLAARGITTGCTAELFCPGSPVNREQMASFLGRALNLPPATTDYFADDAASGHQADINRLAASGITGGCAPARFCPTATVTREQMASFLARALGLPPASRDFFNDDEQSAHEADINRLAAAGIGTGCGGGAFCPGGAVTREQMAAFLHRAFGR